MKKFFKQREFKFRVWFKKSKRLVYDFTHIVFNYPVSEALVTQWTGINDKESKPVFEGDIINFAYVLGDFAGEFMTKKELKEQRDLDEKEFIGVVEWDNDWGGFQIVVKDCPKVPGTTFFPMSYAKGGRVIGNVFQKDKLK
mgnify:FL=1